MAMKKRRVKLVRNVCTSEMRTARPDARPSWERRYMRTAKPERPALVTR